MQPLRAASFNAFPGCAVASVTDIADQKARAAAAAAARLAAMTPAQREAESLRVTVATAIQAQWLPAQALPGVGLDIAHSLSDRVALNARTRLASLGGVPGIQKMLADARALPGGEAEYQRQVAQISAQNASGGIITAIGNAVVAAAPVALMGLVAYAVAPALISGMTGTIAAPMSATATGAATTGGGLASLNGSAAIMSASYVEAASTVVTVANSAASIAAATAQPSIFQQVATKALGAGPEAGNSFSTAATTAQQGANVGGIFDGIAGTVQQTANAVVSVYGSVQGVQLQKAQINLANAQATAAMQPTYLQTGGGINWAVIGLGAAAVMGVFLMLKR